VFTLELGRFFPWRVPLQRAVCFLGTSVVLQGTAVRVRCAHEAWVLVALQGVAARCLWQSGRWALMEITFMPRQERRALACQHKLIFVLSGHNLLNFKFLQHAFCTPRCLRCMRPFRSLAYPTHCAFSTYRNIGIMAKRNLPVESV
jgi:hypothetical protein